MRNTAGASRLLLLSFLILVASLVVIAGSAQDDNLLTNPGFEPPFEEVNDVDQVAEGWVAWNLPPDASRPEFALVGEENADRIREGEAAQLYTSFLATPTAGVYQIVEGVPQDSPLQFDVFAWVWSSETGADPDVSDNPGGVTIEVGIDPTGGEDPLSEAIVWSEPVEQYDDWTQVTVTAEPAGENVTVFVRSTVAESRFETVVYLDEASLAAVSGDAQVIPEQTAEVTDEVEPVVTVTATPEPTAEDTLVPLPTDPQGVVPTETVGVTATQDAFTFATDAVNTATAAVAAVTQTAEAGLSGTQAAISTLSAQQTQNALLFQQQTVTAAAATQQAETAVAATQLAGQQSPDATSTAVIIVITTTPLPTNTSAPTIEATTAATRVPTEPVSLTGEVEYIVQSGDTVIAIAQRFGSTIDAIIERNDLDETALIFRGQRLIIPVPDRTPIPPTATTAPPTRTPQPLPPDSGQTYTVNPGDTLSSIAQRYATTVSALARLNGITNVNSIRSGQVLRLPASAALPAPGQSPTPPSFSRTYRVQPGDNLYAIALRFNTTIAALAQLNDVANINVIFVGQEILIP